MCKQPKSITKGEDWLSIYETKAYVATKHRRHWSVPYIYELIRKNKLFAQDLGKVILKQNIDNLVKSFKKGPPPRVSVMTNVK